LEVQVGVTRDALGRLEVQDGVTRDVLGRVGGPS